MSKLSGSLLLAGAMFSSGGCIAAEGYEVLFQGTQSRLSQADKRQIFRDLGLRLSEDRKTLLEDACQENAHPRVQIEDLNGDGIAEVMVHWGNSCHSGRAGQTASLFVRNGQGTYVKQFDVPGQVSVQPTKTRGYADLLMSGPGFCQGVWAWHGRGYAFKCGKDEQEGACRRQGVQPVCP